MNTQSMAQTKRPGLLVAMVALRAINILLSLLTGFFLTTGEDVRVIGILIITVSMLSLIFTVGLWVTERFIGHYFAVVLARVLLME